MLYLFYGPDEFLRSEAVAALRATLPTDTADLNCATFDGRKLNLTDLRVACEILPFLAEHRLVVVTDALKYLKAGKPRDDFRAFLEEVPPTCHLVLVESETVDRRNLLFSYLKQHGQVQECVPRQGEDLSRWLTSQATALDARLNWDAAHHLVEYVGTDSRSLVTELTKLACFVGRGGRITTEVVSTLVQDEHEHQLFAFIDHLSQRDGGRALGSLRDLLAERQAPTYILFMLARQVRILLATREMAAHRMRPDEIATHLHQKPFVVRKALEQVLRFRTDELETFHHRLLELDHASKTGRVLVEPALEVLVMDVCDG
ncbi:MAG: DNA polymerase III subunit delta [Chloroflexaceae bacterium]|nr:DNA polymerase III subunit delta [Chloroflexaceae bacterium]